MKRVRSSEVERRDTRRGVEDAKSTTPEEHEHQQEEHVMAGVKVHEWGLNPLFWVSGTSVRHRQQYTTIMVAANLTHTKVYGT